jgi:beta-lactamase superfamily II metal-dependent hydrolase
MVEMHFLNVGCGNMTLIKFPNGSTYCFDCNITDDNEDSVFSYLRRAMDTRRRIDFFICSHRDADHVRGVKKLHKKYPISKIRDAGVVGSTTDSAEYLAYMDLRRQCAGEDIKARTYQEVGEAVIRWMHAEHEDYSDANDQSIVMRVEYLGSSAVLAADTSYRPWKERILPHYGNDRVKTNILLGSHHGSITFFDDPGDERNYYTAHMQKIKPDMTLISVGPNIHGLPDGKALELYEKYSSGSSKGNKVYRTDRQGHMKVFLKGSGSWSIFVDQ